MAATKTMSKGKGKTGFVKEMLIDNANANHELVNQAWTKAGFEGTISDSLVKAVRSELGLTGKTRKGAKSAKTATSAKTVKPAAGKTQAKVSASATVKSPRATSSNGVIVEAEADIDRLIFKLMSVGGLSEIEDGLRVIRRKLVLRSHKA